MKDKLCLIRTLDQGLYDHADGFRKLLWTPVTQHSLIDCKSRILPRVQKYNPRTDEKGGGGGGGGVPIVSLVKDHTSECHADDPWDCSCGVC